MLLHHVLLLVLLLVVSEAYVVWPISCCGDMPACVVEGEPGRVSVEICSDPAALIFTRMLSAQADPRQAGVVYGHAYMVCHRLLCEHWLDLGGGV